MPHPIGQQRDGEPQTPPASEPQTPPAAATPEASPAPAGGAEAERARAKEIRNMVRIARLPESQADALVDAGVSVDQARARVFEAWQQADQARGISANNVQITRAEEDTRRDAMTNAILNRAAPGVHKLTDAAREYRGLRLIDLARVAVEAAGGSTRGLTPNEIAAAALNMSRSGAGMNSTSDFPNLLANIANKELRRGYEAAPATWRPLVRQVGAADFKPMTRLQLGDAPALEKIGESGEIKRGTIGEGKEQYAIGTYAKMLGITRQVLINDDLNAFTRIPELFGIAAATLEADIVWGIITGNYTMGDTYALFEATHHGNLAGAGGAIGVDTVGEARRSMRQQKGLNGARINVMAKYLVVPTALETAAEKFLTAQSVIYTKQADANPFAGKLQLIAEPRLDDASTTAWYTAADPGTIDMIEVAYLEGQEGVYIETREGFDVDGIEVKARLDFGAAPIDYRGFYKNPGA